MFLFGIGVSLVMPRVRRASQRVIVAYFDLLEQLTFLDIQVGLSQNLGIVQTELGRSGRLEAVGLPAPGKAMQSRYVLPAGG